MGLFDLFANKNKNVLSLEEKEAAEIFYNILTGYKKGQSDYIPNGIEGLSTGLYYLAFKRTNKKAIRLEELSKPMAFIENRKVLRYLGVYILLKGFITDMCTNPQVLRSPVSLKDCEESILNIMERAVNNIKEI